jgi:D-glycero-alpha-D-manno-heptose 1-phosphate guanylyltransferase
MSLHDLTAVVLAGGRGTRLGALSADIPKPLLPVAGRPFLDLVAGWLRDQGVVDTVYSAGYLGEQVEAWVEGLDLPVGERARCLRESSAMGTGGAVLGCLDLCQELILVANGDTLLLTGLPPIVERVRTDALDGIVVAVRVDDMSRFGSLEVGDDGLLRSFREKAPGAGVVNAGLYLFQRATLKRCLPARRSSLEEDLIPDLLGDGSRIGVTVVNAPFIDIGVPESLAVVDAFVDAHVRRR